MVLPILMLALLFWQCDKINQNTNPDVTEQTCEGCHTNSAALAALATTTGSGDASGSLSPLSPAQRVYIQLGADQHGFSDIDSTHARMSCAGCHSGQSPVAEETDVKAMTAAHQGLKRDPSADPQMGCGGGLCHGDIARRGITSMHRQGWGQKAQLALRFSAAGTSFEQCPVEMQDGFESNCATCHATCGQCHISRPNVTGGGFAGDLSGGNHKFIRKPSETLVCTACHSNTVGVEWRGELAGENPDLHQGFGFTCKTCHTEDFHGAGNSDTELTSLYEVEGMASCYTPCHANDASKNLFHQTHWAGQGTNEPLSCFVCHSDTINHFDSNFPSDYSKVYQDFQIGKNPNYQQSGKPHSDEKWAVVRHLSNTRNGFSGWGIPSLSNYDALETYQYTSPHNLQRWTSRTLADASWATAGGYTTATCGENCHLHGSTLSGQIKPFYLLSEYLDERGQSDEKIANAAVTIPSKSGAPAFRDGCNSCHNY